MIKKICQEVYEGKNLRENLIKLNQMIQSENAMDTFLDEYYEYETCFIDLLDHEDAKVRKNAVKLLGRAAEPVLLASIFEHYQAETTQFVRSDYLIAMEAFDYKEYLPQLKERLDDLEGQERTKHSAEEIKQLQKLIWKIEPPAKHLFSDRGTEEKLLLVVSKGHEAAVLEEIDQIPDTKGKMIKGGCFVQTKHFSQVRQIRTYQALLFDFYPRNIPSQDGAVIGRSILEGGLVDYILQHHKENHPFLFRVDVKGIRDAGRKNQLARSLAICLEENSQGMLVNNSSFYEVEIRVVVGNRGSRVFLRLTSLKDTRFTYRKYAISTSMQPSRAALMMRYVKPYMKEDGNVLDPFCGTGALLIERAFAGGYKSLYGLDISEQAVQAAWDNSQRAGITLQLIHRNFNDFRHEYQFDEILTDMPRKTINIKYKQMEYVYQLLFDRSRELMADKGILAVYCEDEMLMEHCIKRNSWIKRLKKIPMTKDKTSWLYILQKFYIQ